MSTTNSIPLSYTTPHFPALYWPFHSSPGEPKYLYTLTDIWLFTLYWTLITITSAHFLTALWAILMQFLSAYRQHVRLSDPAVRRQLSKKNLQLIGEKPLQQTAKWVWIIMVVYMVIGVLEALLAGSLVGLVLGAVYNAGYFRMSTLTPLLWGIINMLVLILASFRISGGL